MTIIPAILFFLFLMVLMILFRVIAAAMRFKRRVKRTMNGIFNRDENSPDNSGGESDKKRSKVYPKNVGEYVSFEEIEADETPPTENSAGYSYETRSYSEEPRITDVEFEEIVDNR